MIYHSHKFVLYTLCPSHRKITIVDGLVTTIVGQGEVHVNNYYTLKIIVHTPGLFTNLVSIKKFIKDFNYSVIFHQSHCELQEKGMGKMIVHVRERDGLYYIQETSG